MTKESIDFNSRIPYAHGMGLISDELYQVNYFLKILIWCMLASIDVKFIGLIII